MDNEVIETPELSNLVEDIKYQPARHEIYKELRSEVTYEANLAVARTSWFVGSQAFLFSSLATAIKASDKSVQVNLGDSLLFPLIPVLGCLISGLTALSVGAALWRAWRISKLIRKDFQEHIAILKTKENPAFTMIGSASTFVLPLILLATWIGILNHYDGWKYIHISSLWY